MQVNELVFPANFYIIDMDDETSYNSTLVLLGRPFLKTTRAMINVHNGILMMEFDGKVVKFKLFEVMKHPSGQDDELELTNYN